MKFKMEVGELSRLMATAIKGSGSGKFLPITAYANLVLKDGKLSITCTNSTSYITVVKSGIIGEEGSCIVHADKLNKLIQKTTVKELKFEQNDKVLVIKGNGTYRLDVLDENYPVYEFDTTKESKTVKTADFKAMVEVNKFSVSKDMSTPYLTGYSLGEQAITTDGVKMCINDLKVSEGDMLLIPQELADLLEVIDGEEMKIQHDDNKLLFIGKNVTVFGTELSGKEDYPDISGVKSFEFPQNIEVNKAALLAVLDRILIFTNPFDNNGVKVVFHKSEMQVSDIKENNIESLSYSKGENSEDIEALVNIAFFMNLVSAVQADTVKLYFGNPVAIKIENGDAVEILCLMSQED